MTHRLSTQFAAFGLACLLTLAMLGSVDHLATSQPAQGGEMAKATTQVAPQV